jgi:hypothetical protein
MKSTTVMSRRHVPCLAILLVVIVALAPQLTLAADQVPFSAAFATEFESVVAFPIAYIAVVGRGQGSHLGTATAVTTDQAVNLLTGVATATYTLTAANGDTVVLALEVQTTFLTGAVTFEGSYTVAAGTGRFAGATGSGSMSGSATFLGPSSGVGSFAVASTISSPGSSK